MHLVSVPECLICLIKREREREREDVLHFTFHTSHFTLYTFTFHTSQFIAMGPRCIDILIDRYIG